MANTNPILRGFNPDPSIVRVGADYYIATSTFEWFPGVQIHHSTDLVHWELIAHPLDRVSQLDMRGVPDSCGVWAPCLTYHEGTFYLVFSNVKSFDGVWKDTPNYLVTATDIKGPWSAPIFLNASGFDGSLFHDNDGRKWYTSMLVDHRKGLFFGGIILQEYSEKEQKLVGPVSHLTMGSPLGLSEGPHIYRLNDYYYLLLAEGGTEYGHAVSIARSKNLTGPYEMHPTNPIVTCTPSPDHPLQKSGHGDFVWTAEGKCYIVFLVGRPLSRHGRCTLGRESAIEEVIWREDGWPYLAGGGNLPRLNIPTLPERKIPKGFKEHLDFSRDELNIHYQSLRTPIDESWCTIDKDQNVLVLKGRHSLSSTWEQSLIARRLQHFTTTYQIGLDFQPTNIQQLAGLVCYYNTGHYFYLHLAGHTDGQSRFLQIVKCNNFSYEECLPEPVALPQTGTIHLRATWSGTFLSFDYSLNGTEWMTLVKNQDGSILSDDNVRDGSDRYRPAFTGSFVGVCCQDLSGENQAAYFKYLTYFENKSIDEETCL